MNKVRFKNSPRTRIAKTDIAFGFRTTIPKEIRKTYSLKEGMQVIWHDKNGEVRIFFREHIRSIKELKGSIRAGRNLSKISAEEFIDKEHNL